MTTKSVISLSRRYLSRYKHTAIRITKSVLPQKKQLLFVFGGRTQFWPGMGSELYATEPVFRASIQQCDELLREWKNISILPNFEGKPCEDLFADEANVVFLLTSLQVALSQLWKSKEVFPNAIMGVSLGEVAGVYAAGGLTLKDSFRIAAFSARICSLEPNKFSCAFLQSDFSATQALCKKAPFFLAPVYEAAECNVLVLFDQSEKEQVRNFLKTEGINFTIPPGHNPIWPYHTYKVGSYRSTLAEYIQPVQPLPLQCDYYSCVSGQIIPKGAIISNDYWLSMAENSVRTHSALMSAQNAGLEIMLHIGSHPFLKSEVLSGKVSRRIILLDSMRKHEAEHKLFNETARQIAGYKLKPSPLLNKTEDSAFEFVNNFSLYNPLVQQDPYPYFRFLKRMGNVHFLPAHDAWIVLDYDDIETVMKQPQLFSSTLHKTFDECLVGSDPPEHTLVRSLLQPLFSQRVLTELGEFTVAYSNKLLDDVKGKAEFNFVNEFSLPLAQAVVAKFLGLTDAEAQSLKNCISNHVYAMEYLENMRQFFHNYLETKRNETNVGAAALLLKGIDEGKLSPDGAVKLMRLLWVAGMTTTSMLLTKATHEVLKDEQLAESLRDNEQLLPKFIDECLRLEAPETELRRITTAETQLGNKTIPAGAVLLLSLRAANRDANYFEDPDSVLLDRPAKRHLSFGGGYHYCLGAGIAKMEAKYALKAVLSKLPQLKLSAGRQVVYFPSPHFRGISELIVSA